MSAHAAFRTPFPVLCAPGGISRAVMPLFTQRIPFCVLWAAFHHGIRRFLHDAPRHSVPLAGTPRSERKPWESMSLKTARSKSSLPRACQIATHPAPRDIAKAPPVSYFIPPNRNAISYLLFRGKPTRALCKRSAFDSLPSTAVEPRDDITSCRAIPRGEGCTGAPLVHAPKGFDRCRGQV